MSRRWSLGKRTESKTAAPSQSRRLHEEETEPALTLSDWTLAHVLQVQAHYDYLY